MDDDTRTRIIEEMERDAREWHRRQIIWFRVHVAAVLALTALMWWVFIR